MRDTRASIPYTTAVSDAYQDLFGEGIFTGKGLYDVDAFTAALEGRVPENALLSHDLFEGIHARTALVTDVEVVDDYPSSVLAYTRRQHRWVRGDWQILWWLFPYVPTRGGLTRNRLPLISRWKILDNLRRSLLAPAIVALFLFGWTIAPGRAAVWTAMTVGALAFPVALRGARVAQRTTRGSDMGNLRADILRGSAIGCRARDAADRHSSPTRPPRCCTPSASRSCVSRWRTGDGWSGRRQRREPIARAISPPARSS